MKKNPLIKVMEELGMTRRQDPSTFKFQLNYYNDSAHFVKIHGGWFGQKWMAKQEDETEFIGWVYGIFENEIILRKEDKFKSIRFSDWALMKI